MSTPIRAIYEHGQLRLLDTVNLTEGEEIQLMILSGRERAQAALGELLVRFESDPTDDNIDEAALLAEIDADMKGKPTVSDAIIQERREGP